jgi:hypothetical protein
VPKLDFEDQFFLLATVKLFPSCGQELELAVRGDNNESTFLK